MPDRTEPRDEPAVLFGPYRLEIGDASLWNGPQSVPLTPKAFSVLQCLAQRPGRLVTKQELIEAVWPGVFVGDAVLKVCVREIRRALADDPKVPQFIETVHRRGYRFIAPIAEPPAPARRVRADVDAASVAAPAAPAEVPTSIDTFQAP